MIRVGFTGVPGSGKTSTARALVSKLRCYDEFKRVELVQEYARRYISKHGPMYEIWEQYRILSKQKEWEDSVANDKLDILVTDSPVFLGFIYAVEFSKKTEKDVMVYNDIFKLLTKLNFPEHRYDMIFHLPPVVEPVDDGVRVPQHLDPKWREAANRMIVTTMNIFPPKNYFEITSTSLDQRVDDCIDILTTYWGTNGQRKDK